MQQKDDNHVSKYNSKETIKKFIHYDVELKDNINRLKH